MLESRLPDINTAFNTYRTRAIMAIGSKSYTAALGALYAVNGLLPVDYRVQIDDDLYKQKTRTNIFAFCIKCESKHDYNDISMINVYASPTVQLLTQLSTRTVWICPKCKYENPQIKTKMIQTILQEPYFLHVVPKPPKRKSGLLDDREFIRKFERWAWTFIDELEERMAQYRDDNWERGGGNPESGLSDITKDFENEIVS